MSPEKDVEIIEIKEIGNKNNSLLNSQKDFFRIKDRNKEMRLNIYHIVTHALAFLILLPYFGMIIFQVPIPREYSTMVSIVVGFYFAKTLFNQ